VWREAGTQIAGGGKLVGDERQAQYCAREQAGLPAIAPIARRDKERVAADRVADRRLGIFAADGC
jgi:hypothetical protein